MNRTEFQIGQSVDWSEDGDTPAARLGSGPFTVAPIKEVPEESKVNVGHSQWLGLSKTVTIEGKEFQLVYDSYAK